MNVQPAVKAETQKMALGVGLLTVLMLAVFLVIGKLDLTVLLGAVLGCGAAIGNFFLMALTVQKVVNDMPVLPSPEPEAASDDDADGEEKEQPLSDEARQAGKKVQLSYALRMLLMIGIAALAVSLPIFHSVAAVLPMLFPRIVIALRGLLARKEQKEG